MGCPYRRPLFVALLFLVAVLALQAASPPITRL